MSRPSRRPPIDDSYLIGDTVAVLDDYTQRQIEVTVEKNPATLLPWFGYTIHASIGLLTSTSTALTKTGAHWKAQREFARLRQERDGNGGTLERLVDDPANPEPTPAELTRLRHQQETTEWELAFHTLDRHNQKPLLVEALYTKEYRT